MLLPKARFEAQLLKAKHRGGDRIGDGADEPEQPGSDVARAALRSLQLVVVLGAARHDRRRQAVVAMAKVIVFGQRPIGKGARKAAVAVFKRMDGDEVKMRNRGAKKAVH